MHSHHRHAQARFRKHSGDMSMQNSSTLIFPKVSALPVRGAGLGDFLQEPKLAGSWYSQKGPVPMFSSTQENGTRVAVQLGFDAILDCEVTAVEKDLVSWFLVIPSAPSPSSTPVHSLSLLTVGFQTYSSDYRFLLDFQRPNNYRLRVRDVQLKDEGYYHCQLSTHPPQLIWTLLQTIHPEVSILDKENRTVTDIHHHLGSKISIICHIEQAPRTSSSVEWRFTRRVEPPASNLTNSTTSAPPPAVATWVLLNEAGVRGGVRISTWREDEGEVRSMLEMVNIVEKDAGAYTCSLPDTIARNAAARVTLHIVKESPKAVLNSGEPARPAVPPILLFLPLLLLPVFLINPL